ncbi:unannotated protein [freshwater metagenome]|uniref:Unannotated protein n=1 Tax=freshwater metagenome TaxID=449393 RepID=A0A6J7QFA8_9ZZZZ
MMLTLLPAVLMVATTFPRAATCVAPPGTTNWIPARVVGASDAAADVTAPSMQVAAMPKARIARIA